MEHRQKGVLIVGLGLVFIFGLILVAASYLDRSTPSGTSSNNQALPQPKEESQDNKTWISFDSRKDTGLKSQISFEHPSTWVQKGSMDGDSSSTVPFYDVERYNRSCDKDSRGVTICNVTGQVALVQVSTPSNIPKKISYNNETTKNITVNGYQGVVATGVIKADGNSFVATQGQREKVLTIVDKKGNRFVFAMTVNDEASEILFSEIVKTIKISL